MNRSQNRTLARRILATASVAGGLVLAALAGVARADPAQHRGPPPEAFTACEGKESGAVCSVSLHGNDVAGTCKTPPSDTRLACKPNHPPPPPAAAFTACDGKASAAVCSLQINDGDVAGTCSTPPGDTRLACRPDGPPPEK